MVQTCIMSVARHQGMDEDCPQGVQGHGTPQNPSPEAQADDSCPTEHRLPVRRQEQLLWWFPSWCLGAGAACGHRSVARGVGAGEALRSLPTQTIPCFCDILKSPALPGSSP
ncbi:uncharacterized protein ACIB01_019212 [Guaruba guarouba]